MPLFSATLRIITQGCLLLTLCLATVSAEDFGVRRQGSLTGYQNNQYNQSGYRQTAAPLLNVARIIAFDSTGQSFGSGSYIGVFNNYGIILTNWHVVCEAEGLVHVHFPDGFSSFGAVIKTDPKWDLALIAISKPSQSIPTLQIARTKSQIGEPLWLAGFGGGEYRIAEGRCLRYLAPEIPKDGTSPIYDIIEVSVSARQGDSGGPILNARGELAGVLFGSDMIRNSAGSYSERVNRFLVTTKPDMERLPPRPETHFASIEKNGPKYNLEESRAFIPQYMTQASNDALDLRPQDTNSVSGQQHRQATKQRQPIQESVVPIPPLSQLRGIQPSVWADTNTKVGAAYSPSSTSIIQTGFVEIEKTKLTKKNKTPQYGLKLFADKQDPFSSFFILFNAVVGIGLTAVAVRLLKSEE